MDKTELVRFLNKVSQTIEVPRELRVEALGLSERINSDARNETLGVGENEERGKATKCRYCGSTPVNYYGLCGDCWEDSW